MKDKIDEIRSFLKANADPKTVEKYQKYFKEGVDTYGIDKNVYEAERDKWLAKWKDEMDIDKYLDMGDELLKSSKLEEKHTAFRLVWSEREAFTKETFKRVGKWFDYIDNWATTDVFCMLVLSELLKGGVVSFEELKEWNNSESEWKRRAVPVGLNELVKGGILPEDALPIIEPLMLDGSEYVQKGIGTLLRSFWRKYPEPIEEFLLKWKDECGRLIVQYATEKMDKEHKKQFRKAKK